MRLNSSKKSLLECPDFKKYQHTVKKNYILRNSFRKWEHRRQSEDDVQLVEEEDRMLHRNEKEKREISKLMEAFQISVHAYYKVKCLSQFTIKKVNCRNLHPGIKETCRKIFYRNIFVDSNERGSRNLKRRNGIWMEN